nr:unnamed protein product [Digitaria exilis]
MPCFLRGTVPHGLAIEANCPLSLWARHVTDGFAIASKFIAPRSHHIYLSFATPGPLLLSDRAKPVVASRSMHGSLDWAGCSRQGAGACMTRHILTAQATVSNGRRTACRGAFTSPVQLSRLSRSVTIGYVDGARARAWGTTHAPQLKARTVTRETQQSCSGRRSARLAHRLRAQERAKAQRGSVSRRPDSIRSLTRPATSLSRHAIPPTDRELASHHRPWGPPAESALRGCTCMGFNAAVSTRAGEGDAHMRPACRSAPLPLPRHMPALLPAAGTHARTLRCPAPSMNTGRCAPDPPWIVRSEQQGSRHGPFTRATCDADAARPAGGEDKLADARQLASHCCSPPSWRPQCAGQWQQPAAASGWGLGRDRLVDVLPGPRPRRHARGALPVHGSTTRRPRRTTRPDSIDRSIHGMDRARIISPRLVLFDQSYGADHLGPLGVYWALQVQCHMSRRPAGRPDQTIPQPDHTRGEREASQSMTVQLGIGSGDSGLAAKVFFLRRLHRVCVVLRLVFDGFGKATSYRARSRAEFEKILPVRGLSIASWSCLAKLRVDGWSDGHHSAPACHIEEL